MKLKWVFIIIVFFVQYNLQAQYTSIVIKGPSTIRPGTSNSYSCYGYRSYGGTPSKIENSSWEIIKYNPKIKRYSGEIKFEYGSLKVKEFIPSGYEITLRSKYGLLSAEKRITVIPTPPKMYDKNNAIVWWVPGNVKDKNIVNEFARSMFSDAIFGKLISYGLAGAGLAASTFGNYLFGIITAAPFVGPPTTFDLSLVNKGKRRNSIMVNTGDKIIYDLHFIAGQLLSWRNGIHIAIAKQTGEKTYYDPYQRFTEVNKIELLSNYEIEELLLRYSEFFIYPKIPLVFNKPGVYRLTVTNKADAGTRVVYVQVKGKNIKRKRLAKHKRSTIRDGILSDLNNIGVLAQSYYRKSTSMAGGGNSFLGWSIPKAWNTTANGTYSAIIYAQSITIVGIGTETGNDSLSKIKITAAVTPTFIVTTIKN